jgi:hypothetical protein
MYTEESLVYTPCDFFLCAEQALPSALKKAARKQVIDIES